MTECLKIYNYVTGVDDPYFHDAENPILITSFTYTANRMGSVQLTASFYHKDQLDDYWDGKQYVLFRGEKYYVKQVPSSTKDTSSDRYKYDVTFKSERSILDDVYFFDVVTDETENDRYQSNNTNVVFFGDVHEFAKRLNYSLQYSGLDYTVVVDDDVTSESKYVQFEDKFISDVLEEFYNTYNVPYYFDGKTIHIGYTNNAIAIPFAYGANRELLSVTKTNANYRIVNRCTGVGSSDNIPFYYPNETEKGVVEVVCPESNTGISASDVVVLNSNMLGNSLSLADKLEYEAVSSKTINEISSIATLYKAYNEDMTEEYKPRIRYKGLEAGGNIYFQDGKWYADIPGFIILTTLNVGDNESVDLALNLSYTSPTVNFYYPDERTWRGKLFYPRTPDISISDDDGATYTPATDKITISKSGTYRIKIKPSFGGIEEPENATIEEQSFEYTTPYISVGFTYNYNAWTLNGGDEVSLGAYGIKINEGVTPNVGDIIGIGVSGDFIRTTGKLMPSIYRETNGAERFYNALNNTYPDGDGGYLHFDNEYTETDPKEQIVEFPDIKPTIAGITNASGVRIDQIADIAFDNDDSDEVDEDGEYLHPYFYVKLNKFDGEWGFNLFNMAIVGDTNMTLSLTSGNCSAASFEIAVVETDDGRFLNPVQVDDNGDIVPGGLNDKVKTSNIQNRQQDTSANSVWIALRKDDSTFGVVIPNATNNYKPSAGDSFVLLYIDLPEAYKRAAEKRLDDAIIKYMLENNNSKFNFSLQFSRIFFAENPDILAQVNENARIILEYDNKEYTLYISTYTYTVSDDEDLPEISVDLKDTITVVKGTIEQMVDSVVGDTVSSMGLGETKDTIATNTRYFLRKDVQDVAKKRITFLEGATFGNFADMIGGATMDIDPVTGQSLLTVDKLKVRLKAYFDELTVIRANSIGGKHIVTPAGSIICTNVEDVDSAYRCYFANSQDGVNVANMFMVGDLAISESFNVMSEVSDSGVNNGYYWREVVGVGSDYIELSKTKCDADSDVPKEGDVICQLGNISDVSRQGAIVLSSVGVDAPSVTLYSGINTYSYSGKDYIRFGVNGSTNDPFLSVYGSMFFGDRDITDPDSTYITFQQKEGDTKKRLYIRADVTFGSGSSGLSNLDEWKELTGQIDDLEYLKTVFPNNVVDNNGVFLSQLMAVKNSTEPDAVVVAGLYGGGVDALNNAGFKDAEHGVLMMFAGAENIQSVASSKTRIYGDGSLFTEKIYVTGGNIGDFEITDGYLKIDRPTYNLGLTPAGIWMNNEGVYDTTGSIMLSSYPSALDTSFSCQQIKFYGGDAGISTIRSLNIGLKLDVSGAYDDSSALFGDICGNFAIYAAKGAFAGLRPVVRQIKGSATLTEMDHTVIVTSSASSITINLVANPENGQQYYIYKSSGSTVTISGNGKNITRAGISTQPSQGLVSNYYGMAVLIYSSEVNSWIMELFNN